MHRPTDTSPDQSAPLDLERAWRRDPEAFRRWLEAAYAQHPDSVLLQAWQARLDWPADPADPPAPTDPATKPAAAAPANPGQPNLLLHTVLISTLTWAGAKVPDFSAVSENWFYPRFVPWLVISGLVSWFLLRAGGPRRLVLQGSGLLGLALLLLLLLPHDGRSDSIRMALIHMPLLLLSLLGLVFGAGHWRDIDQRLAYIRYGGELLILMALILVGGGVLSLLTLALFGLIDMRLEEWFFEYVVLWGVLSAPLFATWLWDQKLQRQSRLAPLIANVFSPLFLLMTVIYLLALTGDQRSPFEDREFLIVFNALLLVVWGITVFSITGREGPASRLQDLTNLCLLAVTLVIDGIALSAIVYRTLEFGLTPNRVGVTGANLLIFLHLLWILVEYVRALRGEERMAVLRTTIARYLPVYTGWGLFVVLVLPLLFGFA